MMHASITGCRCPGAGHGFCGFGNAGAALMSSSPSSYPTFMGFLRATNSVRDAFELTQRESSKAHKHTLPPRAPPLTEL